MKLPDEIGNMKYLRTLHFFDIEINSLECIKGLRELTSLTDLEIHCYSYNQSSTSTDDEMTRRGREVLRTCLEKLCNLKYLHVVTFASYKICLDVSSNCRASFSNLQRFNAPLFRFSRVPEWIGQLHSLYDLEISVTEVLEDDVEMLARLPSLIHLHLRILGAPKDKIIVRGDGFPVLKHFEFWCSKISFLTFEAGAMAKLERLELEFNAHEWDRCGAAPAGMEHLSGLKEVSVFIGGMDAKESNIRAAESALRNAVEMHPGRPTAGITCRPNSRVIFDEEEIWEREDDVEDKCEDLEDDGSDRT
ncbi:hypothetical protein ACP70R_045577 [Stipagrostis hirtigluma subsp. patula]